LFFISFLSFIFLSLSFFIISVSFLCSSFAAAAAAAAAAKKIDDVQAAAASPATITEKAVNLYFHLLLPTHVRTSTWRQLPGPTSRRQYLVPVCT
jgi:hypothetical protein